LRSGRHLATGLVPRKTTAVDYAPHNEIQLAHFGISRTPTYDVVREEGGGMTMKKRRKLMRPAFLDFGVASFPKAEAVLFAGNTSPDTATAI
jgi:hypothetical protein